MEPLPRELSPVRGRTTSPASEALIGKSAIWTLRLRPSRTVTIRVEIVDAWEAFGRVDCEIKTNTGATTTVDSRALAVLSLPVSKR